jgi:hypothetical protein
MRHITKILLVVLVLLFALPVAGAGAAPSTAGVPGGPFATSFSVQNLGPTSASCSYVVYNDAGSPAFSSPLPAIAPGDSRQIYTPTVTGFPSGTFAGVVSCDQPVATVVNFSDPNKGDTYVGTTNPANTMYVPTTYKDYYDYFTTFRIQNASTSPQNVTVQYFAPGATSPTASSQVNLGPSGSATVDQSAVTQLLPNVSYSAKVIGSNPLAVTVSIYGQAGTPVASQLYAFSSFASGATTVYAPSIMRNYYGYNTATTIQNIGASAANVRLTYSNGTVRTNATLLPNSSWVVLDFNESTLAANVLYASKIESLNSQPLIVTVNESTPSTNRASTYEGLSVGGKTLVAPIVYKRFYKYNSSLTCQNVGTAATNVRISYSGTAISNKTVLTNLGPGKSGLIYQPAEPGLANGYSGSATITADQNIVCVTNQDQNEAPESTLSKDLLFAYDAIVKP